MPEPQTEKLDDDLRVRLSEPHLNQSLPPVGDESLQTMVMDGREHSADRETPGQVSPTAQEALVGHKVAGRQDGLPTSMCHSQEMVLLPLADAPEGVIGKGGEGVVYSYVQRELGREVAVKALRPDRWSFAAIENLAREACVTARLEHPNIVPVHSLHLPEHDGDVPYWVMKRIRGKGLTEHLPSGSEPWPLERLLEVFDRIMDAMAFAHSRGIVHRDLKPDNVLVGEFGEVQVTDWGLAVAITEEGARGAAPLLAADASIAESLREGQTHGPASPETPVTPISSDLKRLNESVCSGRIGAMLNTDAGGRAGTPVYMAPEQLDLTAGSVTERTDVFLLGGILYAMLTGSPPHQLTTGGTPGSVARMITEIRSCSTTANVVACRRQRGLPPAPEGRTVDAIQSLSSITMKALSSDPADRFARVEDMRAAIDAWQARSTSQELCSQAATRLDNAESLPRPSARAFAEVIALAEASLQEWPENTDAQRVREQASTALHRIQRQSSRRFWTAAAAIFLTFLVGGAGYLSTRAQRDRAEARRREAEVARAEAESAKAETEKQKNVAEDERDRANQLAKAEAKAKELALAMKKEAEVERDRANQLAKAEAKAKELALAMKKEAEVERDRANRLAKAEAEAKELALARKKEAEAARKDAETKARQLAKQLDDAYWEAYGKFKSRGDRVGQLLIAVAGQTHVANAKVDSPRPWTSTVQAALGPCPRLVASTSTEPAWRALDYSAAATLLAAGSASGSIQLWDVPTGRGVAVLNGHSGSVNSVCFSPDGATLASGSSDNTIKLWDLAAGRARSTITLVATDGTPQAVHSLSFSADGRTLASACRGRLYGTLSSKVRLWDAATGKERSLRERKRGRWTAGAAQDSRSASLDPPFVATSVECSPVGSTLAAIGRDKLVRFWDTDSGREQEHPLTQGSRHVGCIAFSPDAKTLAAGSLEHSGRSIELLDAATGQERTTLQGHEDVVRCLCFSPDGRTLASGSHDGRIIVWDLDTARPKATLRGHAASVHSLRFSPDGMVLASGSDDNTIKLWEIPSDLPKPMPMEHGRSDESGRRARTTGLASTNCLAGVSFGPDGAILVSVRSEGQRETLKLWDVATGRDTATIRGERFAVTSVAVSPDGATLATGGLDQSIKLWDVPAGREKGKLVGALGRVTCLTFSPDAKLLAAGSQEGNVKLWDLAAAKVIAALDGGHAKDVRCVSFSPDLAALASADDDGIIRLWDLSTGQATATLKGHSGAVLCLGFGPGPNMLTSAGRDMTMRLWDVATGQETSRSSLQSSAADRMCLSPDGKMLASAMHDGTIHIWHLSSAEALTVAQSQRLTGSRLKGFDVTCLPASTYAVSRDPAPATGYGFLLSQAQASAPSPSLETSWADTDPYRWEPGATRLDARALYELAVIRERQARHAEARTLHQKAASVTDEATAVWAARSRWRLEHIRWLKP